MRREGYSIPPMYGRLGSIQEKFYYLPLDAKLFIINNNKIGRIPDKEYHLAASPKKNTYRTR
jgi:hypothetical protein